MYRTGGVDFMSNSRHPHTVYTTCTQTRCCINQDIPLQCTTQPTTHLPTLTPPKQTVTHFSNPTGNRSHTGKVWYCSYVISLMKDFFWELFMLIYGNLIYLKNWKISSDKILKQSFRFLKGCWFLWVLSFLDVEIFCTSSCQNLISCFQAVTNVIAIDL